MNNYTDLKLHGLPGIGVDGYQGDAGKKGNGIYFGYLNDFFESFQYTTIPYIYAESYDPNADAYVQRMYSPTDTSYYTGFIGKASTSNKESWHNVFLDTSSAVFSEITEVKGSAGQSYATIYKYQTYTINDSDIIAPAESCRVVVDMKYINMDTSAKFDGIKSLRFTEVKNQELYGAPDQYGNAAHRDISIYEFTGIDISAGMEEHFPFAQNKPDESSFRQDLDSFLSERNRDFENPSIHTQKINDNIGYVYYHTPFDTAEIESVKDDIIDSLYNDDLSQNNNARVPVFVNNSSIISDLNKYGAQYVIDVPVSLKSDYKAGDILYIWKNNTGSYEKEIEYMIIITPDLEGADYNTIISNMTRIKPFNIFSSDIINNKLVLYNGFNFVDYYTNPKIEDYNLRNNYIYNFIKKTDSSALVNISGFDSPNILNFNVLNEAGTENKNLSIVGDMLAVGRFREFALNSQTKVCIDSDVYLADDVSYLFQLRAIDYTFPDLNHIIAPPDIIFDAENSLNFNFNDNYISNVTPYTLSFNKTEFLKSNINSYNIDVLTWYTIDNPNNDSSLFYNSDVKHHWILKSDDIKCSIDFTDEIIQEANNTINYRNYPLVLNFVLRVFKENISSYYTKPYYIMFENYNNDSQTFGTVTGSISIISSHESTGTEKEIPVFFDLSQNLSWEKDAETTIIVSISNPDEYEFVINEDTNSVDVHVSDNVSQDPDSSENKEFIIDKEVPINSSGNLNIYVKTCYSLIADYSDTTINNIYDLLNYGSDQDNNIEHILSFDDKSSGASVGDKFCYIGINVRNKKTGKVETYYYNIYQKGISEFRIKPKAEFKPLLKNNALEKSNNIDNGILCNQFQYFVDVEITDFDYNTWGYPIKNNLISKDSSVLLDLTFVINSYSNQSQTIKDTQIGDVLTSYSTIHFLSNKKSDLENKYFKFEFDGYINVDPENTSLKDLKHDISVIENDIEIYKDSSLRYQDMSNGGNPLAVVLNMNVYTRDYFDGLILEKDELLGNDGWYKTPIDGFILRDNGSAIASNLQNIGIYSYNEVTFKNLTIENIQNDKLTLRIYFEEDDPVLTYLNYSIALKESKITLKTDSSTYEYVFNSENFYIRNIPTNKEGIHYNEYLCATDNTVFVINPVSLIGSYNTETYVSYNGHNMFGPSDEISSETLLYDPIWVGGGELTTYEYFQNRNTNGYLDDLIQSSIIKSALIPQKTGLQDNIKSISINPINPADVQNTDTTFFELYNTGSLYENAYNPINLNNDETSYLALQYNSEIFRTWRKQGITYFTYNDTEYEAEKYTQYKSSKFETKALFAEVSNTIQQRTDNELESIESWNYEYEISKKYNEDLVIGGVLTKSGNGYTYLDVNDTDMSEKYITDEIQDLATLQNSQNTDITVSSNNTISYFTDNNSPDNGSWYRNLLYTAYWQYPEYVSNYILPYKFTIPSFISLEKSFINSDIEWSSSWNNTNYIKPEYINYLSQKFKLNSNTAGILLDLFKRPNYDIYQYIPYNLCYQIYPRSVVNFNNKSLYTSYNILMLRNPVIGSINNDILDRPFAIDSNPDPIQIYPRMYKK